MDGDKLEEIEETLRPYALHAGECMIQWIEDGCDGQRALIMFNEPQHPFAELCKTDDNRQRKAVVHAIFFEVDNDGNPINKEREHQLRSAEQKGGEYCAAFHILIGDVDFHRYLYKCGGMSQLSKMTENARRSAVEEHLRDKLLKGASSRMLDHDDLLQSEFRQQFLRPFNEWKEERGKIGPK